MPASLTDDDVENMSFCTISLVGRRLVTTSTGYLSLVPESTVPGDVVAILEGCNFPVILRPHGTTFRYIVECYVDGIMDGEAISAKWHTKMYSLASTFAGRHKRFKENELLLIPGGFV